MTTFSARLGSEQLDEVIQDTMEDVMAKLASHAPAEPEAFRAWVLSFAGTEMRAAKGEARRAHARRAKVDKKIQPSPKRMESSLLRGERREIVARYLPLLPEIQRRSQRERK